MKKNILLTIAYDGTDFCGWQRQPAVRTVQGTLEEALSKLCGTQVRINGVSRTDAGVHALGQRASFVGEIGIPTERIPKAVNNLLAAGGTYRGKCGDVQVLEAREMDMDFHARFNACGKRYRYILDNRKDEDDVCRGLFRRNHTYRVPMELDVTAMEAAARLLVGTHDFAAFQSAGGTPRETTVRTIYSLEILTRADGEIWIEVSGDGFLYNMVRILVGTLVEIGQGKREPEEASAILASGDRSRAGHTAPAEGLYLVEVYYPNSEKTVEREASADGADK